MVGTVEVDGVGVVLDGGGEVLLLEGCVAKGFFLWWVGWWVGCVVGFLGVLNELSSCV